MKRLLLPLVSSLAFGLSACPAVEDKTPDPEPTPPQPSSVQVFDSARIGSNGDLDNFQVVRANFDVGADPVEQATLVVSLRSTCFPFEQWNDDPPPAGHNWPASCDAFDRNFHFFVDDPNDDLVDDASVPLELVRAITPFGGPLDFEVDITDVVNGLVNSGRGGVHRLSSHITTYSDGAGQVSGSDGGWNVSARLDLEPGTPPKNVVDVRSIFNSNLVTGSEATQHTVALKDGERGLLYVRTTGHGGPNSDDDCIGPAEEFCERSHRLLIDDTVDFTYRPWREDCQELCTLTTGTMPGVGTIQYCAENPTGSIQSVRAPRANWCPGSITPAFDVEFGSPGNVAADHDISWTVNRIAEGGSWFTSLTVVVFRP